MTHPQFLRTQERYYSPHHLLFQIAGMASREASATEVGRDLNVLKAITFSALGTEAFLNALGFRTDLAWEHFERLPTGEKMEKLCEYFKVPFTNASSPWQTLVCLIGLRNDIVHGKPEHLKTRHVLPEIALEKTRFNSPKSKLESQLTVGNAVRAVQATKNMYEIFRLAVPQDIAFEIFQDGWSGSVSAI